MKNRKKNMSALGFSVLEVLITLSLITLIMGSVGSLIIQQNKQIKFMSQKIVINDLKNSFISTMQDDQSCQNNVNGLTFDSTTLANKSISPSRIRVGSVPLSSIVLIEKDLPLPGDPSLIVNDITLDQLTNIGSGRWSGVWKIKVSSSFSSLSLKPIILNPQTFDVDLTNPSAAFITACHAVSGGGAGSNWTSVNGTDIMYSFGKVGIGPSAPTSRFDVQWQSGDTSPTSYFGSTNVSNDKTAIKAESNSGVSIMGISNTGPGIGGWSTSGRGVTGHSLAGSGMFATSNTGYGLETSSISSTSGFFISGDPSNLQPTVIIKQKGSSTANLLQVEDEISAPQLAISFKGYLGIGNGAPTSPLHVRGQSAVPLSGAYITTNTFTPVTSGSAIRIGHGASSGDTYGVIENMKNGGSVPGDLILNSLGGNVGIGTISPTNLLELRKDQNGPTTLRVNNFDAASNSASATLLLGSNSYNFTLNQFGSGSSGTGARAADVSQLDTFSASGLAISVSNMLSGDIKFYTDGTAVANERMRITNSGNIGIGQTVPGYKLDVNGDVNIAAANVLRFGGTQVCASAGCTAVSDRRLKEDILPLQNSLENILKLQGVTYDWVDKEKYGYNQQIGLIAQDLEKIYPQAVVTDQSSGLKSVAYDHLVAPLIEAFKSINARLNELYRAFNKVSAEHSREIASVKAENAELKARAQKAEQENVAIKARLDKIENILKSK